MKQQRLVLFFTFVLLTNLTFAQDGKKVRLGLTLNPNLGWVSPDNTGWSGYGIRAGIQYGLKADLRLFGDDNYSISTGFTMAHLGGKLSYNDAVYSPADSASIPAQTNGVYKLRYINIPLAIKLRTNEIGYMHYWGVFGSELGFRVKANADFETSSALGNESQSDIDISDNVAAFRADLVIGGGFEYTISGDTRISVGLVYHNGLTNILQGDAFLINNSATVIDLAGNPVTDKELRNRLNYVSLNLGVYF